MSENVSEQERSYRNSWMRYAVLGVLLTVMVVLGVMLYQKRVRVQNDPAVDQGEDGVARAVLPKIVGPAPPELPRQIPSGGGPAPKKEPGIGIPIAGLLTPNEVKNKLVGKWESRSGGLTTIDYAADGAFTYSTMKDKEPQKSIAGRWKLIRSSSGMEEPAARVYNLSMEWTVEGKPAVTEVVLMKPDGTLEHPYLDQAIAGKKGRGPFTRAK